MNRIVYIACAAMGLASSQLAVAEKPAEAKPDRAARMKARFAALDQDEDGVLSKDEFTAQRKDAEAAAKAFARRDGNQDGKLNVKEFAGTSVGEKLRKLKLRASSDDEAEPRPDPESSPLYRDEFGEKGVDY